MNVYICQPVLQLLKPYHDLEVWLSWMDELSEKDYVIIDKFIRNDIYADIRSFFLASQPLFTKAGIGALDDNTIRHEIRGDYTYWLDRKRDSVLNPFWMLVDETIHIFNRYCYLALSGYEFHLANYPPEAHYVKHLDQFKKRNNRTITLVIYLNEGWKKGDGGELEIFMDDGQTVLVEPLAGRCAMFKSAVIPHRVVEAKKNRYSLTGWLLQQPSSLGQFFG